MVCNHGEKPVSRIKRSVSLVAAVAIPTFFHQETSAGIGGVRGTSSNTPPSATESLPGVAGGRPRSESLEVSWKPADFPELASFDKRLGSGSLESELLLGEADLLGSSASMADSSGWGILGDETGNTWTGLSRVLPDIFKEMGKPEGGVASVIRNYHMVENNSVRRKTRGSSDNNLSNSSTPSSYQNDYDRFNVVGVDRIIPIRNTSDMFGGGDYYRRTFYRGGTGAESRMRGAGSRSTSSARSADSRFAYNRHSADGDTIEGRFFPL